MRIDVLTLFPAMFDALTEYGVSGRAVERQLLQLKLWNPRDFATDRHRTVDDRPYGGGPGMVMQYQPLHDALAAARSDSPVAGKVIYLSPQGRRLDQNYAVELAQSERLILIAGRYEGIDERFLQQQVDEEISIGDYVLSGGELPAMVLIDTLTRLLPGALGHEDSAQQDSFSAGLLDHPHFTRPEVIGEQSVPPVLLSGDHAAIERWRLKQALGRTWLRRPELLQTMDLSPEQEKLLQEFIEEYDSA